MKKIFLLIVLTGLSIFSGYCQFKKGDVKLSIAMLPLFGSSDGFDAKINGIVLKPSLGYYISEKTSIDINFSYATLNSIDINGIDSYYNSYSFIPSVRNNFINNEKFRGFAEFGFGLGTIKYNADDNSLRNISHENLSGGISIISLGIGANYFFNENFGIEFIIPYLKTSNITAASRNNVYSGIGPTVGFTYLL